ncbi:MAG: hypothetical protein NTX56_04345 [Proteobacteria bacterium]|nr:hypothetical protein [Pseudomonadota bacterium]
MANVRIEIDRGNGWQLRHEGSGDFTVDVLVAQLPHYTWQYPHRAFLDGVMVASSSRKGRKVEVVRL